MFIVGNFFVIYKLFNFLDDYILFDSSQPSSHTPHPIPLSLSLILSLLNDECFKMKELNM